MQQHEVCQILSQSFCLTACRYHLNSTGRLLYNDQILQHIVNSWISISIAPVALKVIYDLSLHLINPLCTLTSCTVTVVTSIVGLS